MHMSLPAWAIRAAGSVVNVGLLALFVVIFIGAILAASEGRQPAWANDKERVAFATGLASYVGGIVAVTLGQRLPTSARNDGGAGDRDRPAAEDSTETPRRFEYLGEAVAGFIPRGLKGLRIALALCFALVYFSVSAWAVIVWFQSPLDYEVPDMVKNLVSVSIGLAFLLGRTVFYEE
jgi:hypothetical protein